MEFEQYRQGVIDENQLGTLPILYWISGGMTLFFSLYFLIYVALGLVMAVAPVPASASASASAQAFPAAFGWLFFAIGLGGFLVIATLGVLKVMCGFWLRRRTHRVGIMVVAAVSCLEIPYGTAIGVFTFLLLSRPSVTALFDAVPKNAPTAPEVAAVDMQAP